MRKIVFSAGIGLREVLSVVCAFCHQGSDGGAVCAGCVQDMHCDWQQVPRCWRCGQGLLLAGRVPSGRRPFRLCAGCRRQSWLWQRAAVVADYSDPWTLWLQQLKMQKKWQLARPMGQLMGQAWQQLGAPRPVGPTVWVPIPARQQALRERGFNPANELARYAVPEVSGARLVRALRWQSVAKHQQQPQKWRSRWQRRYDLLQAFTAPRSLAGQDVVLVDDILTTGFTLQSAARACMQAGAHSVWAAVFARTPRL